MLNNIIVDIFIYYTLQHFLNIPKPIIWFDLILMFNATFNNISAISWRPVVVVKEARVPGENHRPWASTVKIYHLRLRVECTLFSSPGLNELLSSLFVRCPSSVVCRPSSVVRRSTFHILIFSSETTGPIATKLWWNGPWMAPFQNCVRWSRLPTKMAAKLKIEKWGGWNFDCPLLL